MSGRSTTMISYEPPNDTGDHDHDHDRDPDQLAKLQEKASSQLLFCKCSEVSKSFCKCSKTLFITNPTGSSSGETERSSTAKHSSQRGRGEGESRAGEQRHHGGQVHLSFRPPFLFLTSIKLARLPVIHYVFFFKNMIPYNTCRKDRISF